MSRIIATSKRPLRITLAIALLFHAALLSLQTSSRIDTSFIRSAVLDSLGPLERFTDRGIFGVRYIWERYFALVGVYDENQELQKEVESLKMQLSQQNEQILEAERLRHVLSIQNMGIGKSILARVIGRDPARGNQSVTIDKGRAHGVRPDSAVITPAGVVGRVIHSSNFFSIVQLILDSQSGVGVMLRSTRRQGIIKGSGTELELDYIEDDNDLKENDDFITSGLDRIYPKGLAVGVIESVGQRRGLFRTVRIRPSADFSRLEEVICIIDAPAQADILDPAQESHAP